MEDKGVLRAMARSGWGQGRAWAGVEGRQGATERLRGKATQAGPSLSEGQRAGRDPGAGEGRSGRLRRRLPLRAQGSGSGPSRTSGGGSASGLISSGRKSHFLGCVSDSLYFLCACGRASVLDQRAGGLGAGKWGWRRRGVQREPAFYSVAAGGLCLQY